MALVEVMKRCFRDVLTSLVIVFCSALPLSCASKPSMHSNEGFLMHFLLKNYDRTIRPVRNPSDKVNVSFGITLQRILNLDNRNQVLYANMWITLRWSDHRFIWSTKQFGNVSKVRVSVHEIWIPDVILYNRADEYPRMSFKPVNAIIFRDGSVEWMPPVMTVSSCPLEIFYFPFDVQLCTLKFASWSYDLKALGIQLIYKNPDLSEFIDGSEWALIRAANEAHYSWHGTYACNHADVTVLLCMQRRPTFYWVNILGPCVSLNLLCLAAFWQPPTSNGKVVLSVTIMLSHFVYLNVITERLPSSHKMPIIGIYLLLSLSLSIFAVVFSITTLKIYYRTDPHQRKTTHQRLVKLRAAESSILTFFSHQDHCASGDLAPAPPATSDATQWKRFALKLNSFFFLLTSALMLLCYVVLLVANIDIYRRRHAICDELIANADNLPGTLHGN